MSENDKSQEQLRQETAIFMEKNTPKRINNVPVTKQQAEQIRAILLKKKEGNENLNESENEIEQLKQELEDEKTTREQYEASLKLIGEQKLKEKQVELRKLGYKGNLDTVEAVISAQEHLGIRKKDDGGKGSIPMTVEMLAKEHGNSGNSESFNNHAEMISYLKSEIRKGNETAKEQYAQLVKKTVDALKEKNTVWTDNNPDEPSIISNILSERNKKFRELKTKGDS